MLYTKKLSNTTRETATLGHSGAIQERNFAKRDLPESRNCRNRSLIRTGNPRDVRCRAAVCGTA